MNNDENTIFGTATEQQKDQQQKQTSGNNWQQVTIGGVTGILMGAAGMFAANAFAGEQSQQDDTQTRPIPTATWQPTVCAWPR